MSGNMDYNRALGEKKFWHVGATLNTSISQSTDMSSLTGQTEAQRNRVTSTRLGFSPNVRFQKDKLTFTLKGAGSWQHIHRSINVTNMPADVTSLMALMPTISCLGTSPLIPICRCIHVEVMQIRK